MRFGRLATTCFATVLLGFSACHYQGPTNERFQAVKQAIEATPENVEPSPAADFFSQTADAPLSPVPLESLVERAVEENPEIDQARLEVAAAGYQIELAHSLPDPMLGTTTQLSPVQTAAGQQDFGLAISQKVIRRNKRQTRALVAENRLNGARAKLKSIRQQITGKISSTYYELGFVQACLEVLNEDKKELQLINSIVDRRFRILREATQQETLQVQVSISRLESEIARYRQSQRTLVARLVRLTHLKPGTNLTVQPLPQNIAPKKELDRLIAEAIQNNPELHSQLFEIRQKRDLAELANLNSQPDYTVGINWISTANNGLSPFANGQDSFMLTLGMNLPVYRNRIDAEMQEARIRTLVASKKYESLKDEMAELVTEQILGLETTNNNLILLRNEMIPKQKLVWDQSLKDYELGKTDFLQMIENWRALLQYRIMEQRMVADLHKTLAELAQTTGASLESSDDSISQP
ncbi:MAG: TolC family protein [Planctomycetota bacterium]|nr:TolC family protein [Planctomycetota bacterium]